MAVSTKQKTALVVAGSWILAAVVDLFLTIYRLNVEEWAKEQGYDKLYKIVANPPLPEWLITAWDFLIGPFGFGFALGALLFGLWEYVQRFLSRRSAKDRLEDLFAEGVGHRNNLLLVKDDYEHDADRAILSKWSERTVQKLKDAGVSRRDRSRFRTLDTFQPEHPLGIGDANRDRAQIGLEVTWNEKLRRLREIIDALGA